MKNSKRNKKYGFTLIELMVAVIIIAVLAAVAVPQYKKAVLKSRYSTLMPVANSLAKGNEVYYLSQGEYSTEESKLDVEGQVSAPEGTEITLETDPEYLSYVRVANDSKVPNARYVVYQAHSANFAGTTMCEAKDDTAKELCQSLGGVFVSENGTEAEWTAYLLSGDLGAGDSFIPPPTCPENGVCDENFQLTGCASGHYVKDGACVAYDYGGNSDCSGTCNQKTFGDNAKCTGISVRCYGSAFNGESSCDAQARCYSDPTYGITTFTDDASCTGGGLCNGAILSGRASCTGRYTGCQSYLDVGYVTKFTEESTCTDHASCSGAEFSGNSSCNNGNCMSSINYGITTFTDNASCIGNSDCRGSVFSGNSICTGSYCSSEESSMRSTFKENAVCAGSGCNTAIFQDNACCSNCNIGTGKPKCGGGTW